MTSKKSFLQNWNLDKTLSLMAFLISLGTFFLLYYQTNLTRKQQYASVFPYLELFNQGPRKDIYIFSLTNKGIGPAFIKKVEVHYKDSIFEMDPVDFFYSEIYPKDTLAFAAGTLIHSNLQEGTLVPAGAILDLFKLEGSEEVANKLRALFGNGQARLRIVYTSVYDEEWVLRTGNFPEKIK